MEDEQKRRWERRRQRVRVGPDCVRRRETIQEGKLCCFEEKERDSRDSTAFLLVKILTLDS